MGKDKIEQHVEIADSAQTGDITLIGKIENVIKVIRQPALWQDAAWGFFTQNWIFVFSCILIQTMVLLVYLKYKNLFLIPVWICVFLEISIVLILWGINLEIRNKLTRKNKTIPIAALGCSILLIGWTSYPILRPERIPSEKFGILVATFGEGADYQLSNTAGEISGQVYEGLCLDLQEMLAATEQDNPCDSFESTISNVVVRRIGVIPDSETAKWYAHRINADVVIWGQVLTSGKGTTTIRFQIEETLDQAVNPEFPMILPVTTTFTEVTAKEIDFDSDPVRLKEIVSQQTTYISSFALGLYAFLQRNFVDAVAYFESAKNIADSPHDIEINPKSKALIYMYLGRSYNAMGIPTKGHPLLLDASNFNPGEPAIMISLGLSSAMLGRNEDRDTYLNNAITTIDEWLVGNSSSPEAATYDRGLAYQELKMYSDAAMDYEAVIRTNPKFFAAYINLALSYAKLDEFDKAVSLLNKVIELSGTSNANPAWAHLCLAYVQEKRENYGAAREEYQKAIYNLPDSAELYGEYGSFLERQNELIGARAALNQMLITAGDKGWAYGTLADFLLRQGSISEAITNYLNAIHYKPGDWLLHTMLAEAYSKNGNPEEAKVEFEKAIRLPDVSYYSFAQYASFRYRQGEYVAAEGLYLRALELYAGNYAVYLNLGQTYQALNKTQEAVDIYRYVVNKADLFPEAAIEIANQRLLALEVVP